MPLAARSRATNTRAPRAGDAAGRERAPLTPQRLAEALLSYLNQRDASRARAALHLERWITKHYGAEQVDGQRGVIQALLERYAASGLLDDQRLAAHLIDSFRRRGASQRGIAQKLRARGLSTATIQRAFEDERSAQPAAQRSSSAELDAARAFAKKRRLGVHRPENERAEHRRKDLTKLARAGFDFDTACSALGGSFSDDDF